MSRFFLLLLGAARIGACNASAGARRAQDDVAPPVDEADPPPVEQFEVDTREHISDFHDVPSSFTVPELTMSSIGYVALAELPDGAAIAVSHSFVGVTDVGHVAYTFEAVRKAGSVHTNDYAAALASAKIKCRRADGKAEKAHRAKDGTRPRHDLVLTFKFPETADATTAAATAHFLARVRAPDAYLIVDQEIHLTHPSFATGTRCARHVHWEHSTFSVVEAADTANGGVALTLMPVLPRDTHHMINMSMTWDPDAARAVARRRAAGQPVGVDARRRLRGRDLKTVNLGSASLGMNWNGDTAKPESVNKTIDLVPTFPGLLSCENCFAYVQAVYNLEYNFCLGINVLNFIWFYTSNVMTGEITNSDLLRGWRAKSAKAVLTAENLYDCTAAFAPWAAAAADNKDGDWVPEQTHPNSAYSRYINAAFNVDAKVGGTAAFNFLVTSKGFSTAGIYPPTGCNIAAGAADSSACAAPAVLASSPLIVLSLGYVSATIWSGLLASATWSGTLTGSLKVGAAASLGTPCAPVKLGGRVMVTDMDQLISDCGDGAAACLTSMGTAPNVLQAYTSFPFSYSLTPLEVKLDANVGAAVDVSLSIATKIVISGCIPINAGPLVRLSSSAALGQARRASSLRALAPTVATCPRTGAFFGSQLETKFVASVGPTTVRALLSSLNIISAATMKKLPACLLDATIIPYTVISPPAANLVLPLAAACLQPSTTLKNLVDGGAPVGAPPLPPSPVADDTLTALNLVTTGRCSSTLSALWTSTSLSCSFAAMQASDYQQVMCDCAESLSGSVAPSDVCVASRAAYQLKYFPPPPPPTPFPWALVIGCAIAGLIVILALYLAFKHRAWLCKKKEPAVADASAVKAAAVTTDRSSWFCKRKDAPISTDKLSKEDATAKEDETTKQVINPLAAKAHEKEDEGSGEKTISGGTESGETGVSGGEKKKKKKKSKAASEPTPVTEEE